MPISASTPSDVTAPIQANQAGDPSKRLASAARRNGGP